MSSGKTVPVPVTAATAVTAQFCAQLRERAAEPLAPAVAQAARRSLFNIIGTAVGGARTDAVEVVLATALERRGRGEVTIPGRQETLDPHWGALAIGTAAHYDDFDDTHLATVIHPAASVLATVLALAPGLSADGADYLSAFAFGCEAQLRIGVSISPNHYDRGWHITGTCGVFGATVAASLLLGLDAAALEHALALASLMVVGQREAFGSMTKPLHAGKAALNGILAARLARAGVAPFPDPLADGGVLSALADRTDSDQLRRDWAGGWELEQNTFKPYPCGIVAHPLIDAGIAASGQIDDPGQVTAVHVICNPLVPELMGRRQPEDGLKARFSSYHGTACGLLDGRVGLEQFSDERATAADARRLRDLITLEPTPDCARDEATLTVQRTGAEPVVVHIEHARGSLARPLTDADLLEKVTGLTEPVLGPGAAQAISNAVNSLASAPNLDGVLAAVRPSR